MGGGFDGGKVDFLEGGELWEQWELETLDFLEELDFLDLLGELDLLEG